MSSPTPRVFAILACLAAIATGHAAAGTGGASWKPPTLVERTSSLPYTKLAMTPGGLALLAWAEAQDEQIHYAIRRGPGAQFGRTREVALDAPGEEVHRFDFLGLDAGGDAIVGYRWFDDSDHYGECCSRQAVRVRANGRSGFGSRQTLSLPGDHALNPSFAAASDGRSAVVWFDRDEVWLSERRPGKPFGRPIRVADWKNAYDAKVLAAYDDAGTLVVAWAEAGRLRARFRSAEGRFGRVTTIDTPGDRFEPDYELALAANGSGRTIVAAAERVRNAGSEWRMVAAEREPGAMRFRRGRVLPLGEITPHTGRGGAGWSSARSLAATLDRRGRGLFSWYACNDEICGVEVMQRKRDGRYTPSRTISTDHSTEPELAMSERGEAVLTWTSGLLHGPSGPRRKRFAAVARPGRAPGSARELGDEPAGQHHQVAIDAAGNALTTWMTLAGVHAQAYEP